MEECPANTSARHEGSLVEDIQERDALFLVGMGIEALQQRIAHDIAYPPINAMGLLAYYRPRMQEQAFRHRRTPSKSESPSRYYDSLRVSEEAIRQAVARGVGDLAVSSMAQWAIDGIASAGGPSSRFMTVKEMSRGRTFLDVDAAFVEVADVQIRRACESAIAATFRFDRGRVMSAFSDSSERIRSLASRTLDLRLGKDWRRLDPAKVARLEPLELDGKPIGRYDRHLLLKPRKNLSLEVSVSNAASTAAEFAVSSMIDVNTALRLSGYPQDALFPVLFANVNKLSLAARLPFWPAHKVSENTKHRYTNGIFRAVPDSYETGVLEIKDPWFKNYFEKGLMGTCQGARLGGSPLVVNDIKRQQRIGWLFEAMREIATVDGQALPLDIPEQQLDPPNVTSAQAATILALSAAYADRTYRK